MTATLEYLRAIPLTASFAAIYGGEERIPEEVRRPSSHFQAIQRLGQYCTLVFARSSDGATGVGECFGLPTPYPAAEIVNRVMAPALIGAPLAAPAEMTSELQQFFMALGHTRGPAMEALSGVDIALWDLKARRAGQPLAYLLGANPRAVATYVSPVPFLPRPDLSAEVARKVAEGFDGVKLKIGRADIAEDLAHIGAVRDAIGPECRLMLDANCAYGVAEARELIAGLAGLDIAWLEEPLPPEDTEGLLRLASETDIPLAGGENEFTPGALERLMDLTGLRILQPNITRIGGVSAMLELDAIVRSRGARIAPHGVGASVAVACSLHVACALESISVFEVNRLPNPLRDRLGAKPSFDSYGHAFPPVGPGHGVEIPEGALSEFVDCATRLPWAG
jgi:D-galactarolactone cycloisomerase